MNREERIDFVLNNPHTEFTSRDGVITALDSSGVMELSDAEFKLQVRNVLLVMAMRDLFGDE